MYILSFSQKNDLVLKHKAKKHFSKDLELFQKHFPSSKLMNELGLDNEFTFERLDGQMLYLLLDKISLDEILSNREETQADPSVEVRKEKILEERINALEESAEYKEDKISSLYSELEEKDTSIEDLQSKIEALENRPPVKKKEKKTSSR